MGNTTSANGIQPALGSADVLHGHEHVLRLFLRTEQMVLELDKRQSGVATEPFGPAVSSPLARTKPVATLRLKHLLDRRRETRYPANDPAVVELLHGDSGELPSTVRDVSRSGLRLELKTSIAKGTRVKVTLAHQFVIYGEVRYCRRAGTEFQAGILVKDLFDPRQPPDEHINEDEFGFYAVGRGLTVPEVIKIKNHLVHCESCRVRLGEVHSILNPVRKRKVPA